MARPVEKNVPVFRPRARLMLLLGDQLIRDSGVAAFELVKNAYDADATGCIVSLCDIDRADGSGRITVDDDGHGMDLATVLNVWLEPGTEYRKDQRESGWRTSKFNRLPLGEKGVGRFAVHKLGRHIVMTTRKAKCPEVVVEIDWCEFEANRYLSEVPVNVYEREALLFTGPKTGTRIEVTGLRESPWSRRRVRALYRAVTAICSPFKGPDTFAPMLEMQPASDWLDGLLRAEDVLDSAPFHFHGDIVGSELCYTYRFKPMHMRDRVEGRIVRNRKMAVTAEMRDPETDKKNIDRVDLGKHAIGPIKLEFRVFDRDPGVLKLTATDRLGLLNVLNTMGGVRVYRDGMRVYDFGEPGNDWLELGGRRVNVPARRISNNLVMGAITLHADESTALIEKTNREGFVENEAYREFWNAVRFAIQQAEQERYIDKSRIRKAYSKGTTNEPVLDDLGALRTTVGKLGLSNELGPYLDRIESQYRDVQDRLLVAAGAGLNLAAVMHEIEKGILNLKKAIEGDVDRERLVSLAKQLSDMVDGLSWLTKKTGQVRISARVLIRQAILNSEFRFRGHGIRMVNGMDKGDPDFEVRCSRRLITAALMNLIDNAIYWVDNKGAKDKQVYLGTTFEMNGLPAIVVADNGQGFHDPPEYVVQPFFSRKPDGIGLGLHITEEIMKSHKGRLLFAEKGDITLPRALDGAVILLEFGKTR